MKICQTAYLINIKKNIIISMTIYILFIAFLLAQAASQSNLQNYGNGNFGAGPENKVNGANNTWNGTQNTINGKQNTVKGNQNQISGSSNYVEGSNNKIGNLSPEEIAKLQNEMIEKLQTRFSNLGIFKTNNTATTTATAASPTSNLIKQANDKPAQISKPGQQNNLQTSPQIPPKQAGNDEKKLNSQSKQRNMDGLAKKSANYVVFRTYGTEMLNQIQDWFNQKLNQNHLQVLLKRFGKSNLKNRRIFYSSLYQYPSDSFEK